jgi:hypothetical protein
MAKKAKKSGKVSIAKKHGAVRVRAHRSALTGRFATDWDKPPKPPKGKRK